MFDTHCHLNFKAFKSNLDEVIKTAKSCGIEAFLVPGTDIKTSEKAVEIAEKYENIYAAVGIHPHNVYEIYKDRSMPCFSPPTCASPKASARRAPPFGGPSVIASKQASSRSDIFRDSLEKIKELLVNKKVVAIGEVGIDCHPYEQTKYANYQVDEKFIDLQKESFIRQIKLAIKYGKSLIIHNREATEDVLPILENNWDKRLAGHTVFHCCEPEDKLLNFAIKHNIYIGVDGDITYSPKKQEFIKQIPLDLLVLETDSPFLLPEPLKSQKKYPNTPANLPIIVGFITQLIGLKREELVQSTFENSLKLFSL